MENTIGKILIVDDDKNITEVIKLYLENSGYSTKVVHGGRTAQEAFFKKNQT